MQLIFAFFLVMSFYTAQTQVTALGKRGKLVLPTPMKAGDRTHSYSSHETAGSIFTHPVKKGETITLTLDHFVSSEDSEITVINMIGKLILNDKITTDTYKLEVTGERFVDGVYLVKIKQGEKKKVERLVVK